MNLTTAILSISLLSVYATQAQTDSRFDGIWVGTETVTPQVVSWDAKTPKPPSQSAKVTIAIAQGGTMVGVIGGFSPGRYKHVWRDGDAINFDAGRCKLNVRLSPDGKTLIENGSAAQVIGYVGITNSGYRAAGYRNFQISGTLHRQ